jgi:hypothetical protein
MAGIAAAKRPPPLVEARDELVAAADLDAPELRAGRHLEARAAAHDAVDRVGQRVAAAVEVEPEGAREREPIGRRVRVAAALLDEAKRAARLHQVGGQVLPVVGKRRLRRVHRHTALDADDPQLRARVEHPHLAVVPRAAGIGARERVDGPRATRDELDAPGARAHLHAQAAVRVEAGGERARERERHQAVGKRAAEDDLAAASRDLQPHPRLEAQRDLVDDAPVRGHLEPLLRPVAVPSGALLEPEPAFRVAVGERDVASAQSQADDPRLGRDLKQLGQRVPAEDPGQRVASGGKPRARATAHGDHRHGLAVGAHLLGPALRGTRERHLLRMLDEPFLGEAPLRFGEVEFEARRPDAGAAVAGAVQERTARIFLTAQHPIHPGRERRGHVLARERLGAGRARRECGDGEQNPAAEATAHSPCHSSSLPP